MVSHLVLNISAVVLGVKQVRHRTSLGPNRLGADLRRLALGNAVEDLGQLVASVFADLLRALRVVVVESLRGTQRLDEGEVARRASSNNLTTTQHSKLNRQTSRSGAATINQQRLVSLLPTPRQRQAKTLVQPLADSRDSHAEGGGVLVGEVVRELALDVALGDGVLREAAVLLFDGVDAVGEAGDAVADLEVLGDFGADFDDGAGVVAAVGADLALLGEAGDGDVLPLRGLVGVRDWLARGGIPVGPGRE